MTVGWSRLATGKEEESTDNYISHIWMCVYILIVNSIHVMNALLWRRHFVSTRTAYLQLFFPYKITWWYQLLYVSILNFMRRL